MAQEFKLNVEWMDELIKNIRLNSQIMNDV